MLLWAAAAQLLAHRASLCGPKTVEEGWGPALAMESRYSCDFSPTDSLPDAGKTYTLTRPLTHPEFDSLSHLLILMSLTQCTRSLTGASYSFLPHLCDDATKAVMPVCKLNVWVRLEGQGEMGMGRGELALSQQCEGDEGYNLDTAWGRAGRNGWVVAQGKGKGMGGMGEVQHW